MTRDEIQGLCALHSRLAKMGGRVMDKTAMRFSAMADYVDHVRACGSDHAPDNGMLVVWESVETAIVGSAMHTGKPFDRNLYRWMETA